MGTKDYHVKRYHLEERDPRLSRGAAALTPAAAFTDATPDGPPAKRPCPDAVSPGWDR